MVYSQLDKAVLSCNKFVLPYNKFVLSNYKIVLSYCCHGAWVNGLLPTGQRCTLLTCCRQASKGLGSRRTEPCRCCQHNLHTEGGTMGSRLGEWHWQKQLHICPTKSAGLLLMSLKSENCTVACPRGCLAPECLCLKGSCDCFMG